MKTKTLMDILGDDPSAQAKIYKMDCKDAYEAERWLRQHTDATLVPGKGGKSKWLEASVGTVDILAFYDDASAHLTAPIDDFETTIMREVNNFDWEHEVEVLITHYAPANKPRWDEEQFDAEIEFEVYTPGVDTPWVLSKKDWLKIADEAIAHIERDQRYD